MQRPIASPQRTHSSTALLAACFSLFMGCAFMGCGEIAPERPNILIFVVSSLRADALSAYDPDRGGTPHFDELAIHGVTFEEAYSTSSWTRPAMASLLSGLYPWHHGVNDTDDHLSASIPSLAGLFSEHGYTSALITANPNVGPLFGFEHGFDESIELYSRSLPGKIEPREFIAQSETVVEVALKWIEERPRPYFLVVLAIDPHAPYLPPRNHDAAQFRSRSGADGQLSSLRRLSKSRTPDDEARIRELYQAEVKSTDESFGKLITALKKDEELEETIVVVTGDHGEAFWEYDIQGHGESLSRELLRVPLIIRYPRDRRLPPGARTAMPISSVDLGPTLLELSGFQIPNRLDGESFFGSAIQARTPVLAGLDTQAHTLLAAIKMPYKLLWDRNRGEISLFDMRISKPEAEPYDPRPDKKAARAREELLEALIEGLRVRDEEVSGGVAGDLSPDMERELRALGHTP